MTLFDLSLRSMKRNFRLYSIYFISMLIGAVIQFTFSALMFNDDVLTAIKHKDNYQIGVSIMSAAVFLFIIFFILYANSFFMKQRKKEFGMYLLYGMSERQLTLLVFLETLLIGAVSIVGGTLVGGLLSKFFGMLLMNLMDYDEVISFSFPLEAVGSIILLFAVLIGIITLQSHLSVRRVQLVELFHAKEKMDRPFTFSATLAIGSVLLLGIAYFLISQAGNKFFWKDHYAESLITATVGIIGGTYLFFRQFFGWLLERISRGRTYHEGSRMLWVSSLRFSIRGNTLNLTFISLFSTLIIFLVGFVAINYAVQFDAVKREFPNPIAFASQDEETTKQVERLIGEDYRITGHARIEGLPATPVADGNNVFPTNAYTDQILLFAESQYNGIARLRGDGDRQVSLRDEEAVALIIGLPNTVAFAEGSRSELAVKLGSGETTFHIAEKKDYTLLSKATDANGEVGKRPSTLIVSDAAYERLKREAAPASFELYQFDGAAKATALSHRVHDLVTAKTPGAYYAAYSDLYSVNIESSSLLLFSVAFLAVIALFALGSIIYFKQLREATEEQRHYEILRKIGVDDREMRKVIRRQLLLVFLPPLLLGMLHSWLMTYYPTVQEVKDFPQLTSIISAILILYFAIYGLFYWSSTGVYYKIVNPGNAMS